jgi:D-alanyl-D-alanine carboxypeptidase
MSKHFKHGARAPLFTAEDLTIAVFGLIFCLLFFVLPVIKDEQRNAALALEAQKPNPFAQLELKAQAAYVLDIKSGKVIYDFNSEASLPLASLTKVMTAVTALESVPESTVITIDKDDLVLEGDSGLFANERWKLQDLLSLTLIESSNDGAYAVSGAVGKVVAGVDDKAAGREAFVRLMNSTAQKLGMSQTFFTNPTGLDEGLNVAGAYGSAKDVATLMSTAVNKYPDLFRNTKYPSLKFESLSELSHTAINTNKGLNAIPIIVASKTGFTDLAGGNLAVVFNTGISQPIAVVVLHSTQSGRFEDVNKLVWATLSYLQNN